MVDNLQILWGIGAFMDGRCPLITDNVCSLFRLVTSIDNYVWCVIYNLQCVSEIDNNNASYPVLFIAFSHSAQTDRFVIRNQPSQIQY